MGGRFGRDQQEHEEQHDGSARLEFTLSTWTVSSCGTSIITRAVIRERIDWEWGVWVNRVRYVIYDKRRSAL